MRNHSYLLKFVLILTLSLCCLANSYSAEIIKKNAPFLFELTPDVKGLLLPSDIAVSKKNVYVVDGGHHRIAVFNKQGEFQYSFGQQGKTSGNLNFPVGIDVAANGDVYVADSGNRRVQVYSARGQYKRSFKIKQGKYLIRPIDVLVDEKSREIFVTANETHSMMVYSLKGKRKRQWGDSGSNEGQFRYPATLAHLKDQRIAVVDVLNSRVQIFDKSGDYNFQLSGWGVTQGKVFRPKGVAVDWLGRVYISDSYMNVVQVFTDDGSFQYVLDTGRALRTPVGMAIDNKRLYVTEMRNNRVSVFGLEK